MTFTDTGLVNTIVRDITSFGSLEIHGLIFLGLLAVGKIELALQFLVANVVCMAVVYAIRFLYFRARPGRVREKKYKTILHRLDASSFPSIHGYRSALLPIVLSQGLPLAAVLLLWALGFAIAFSRLYLKHHHPSDVITGFVLGLVVSYLTITFLVF
ncbi:MAG: phosphatase PAP2 family protein [archaeon]|nr:MAG: phosphatase PAP2 family protein [archaeon]